MNNDVLQIKSNAVMQASSDNLMDAASAAQENVQAPSTLGGPFKSAFSDIPEPEPSSAWLRPVPESITKGTCAPVDSDPPDNAGKPSEDSSEQFDSGKFVHDDASIDYRLYIPPASVSNGSLLVMLHGCSQEAGDFSTGTAMNTLARDAGYTVLYPNQSSSSNPNRCWNWFVPAHQQREGGEPALISALTQSICSQQGLDPARVFVAGLSAGGAMALILAEEFPDVFAAVGVHSGLATGLASSTAQALRAMSSGGTPAPLNPKSAHRPTMVIHCEQDRTVNAQNAGVIVERCLDQYRQQNSGEELIYEVHEEAEGTHAAQRHEYRNDGDEIVCRHLQLSSIGHAWSGGNARGSYTAADGISASESLLKFFGECPSLSS